MTARANTFHAIYANGVWNDNNPQVPLSGPGSSMTTTASFRAYLDTFCEANDIKSIVDIGCGDLTWMPSTRAFTSCAYTGLDIVPTLIDQHRVKYPQHTFAVCDVIRDELPSGDVAIIRDITFHMKHEELVVFLKKLVGKFRFCFITSCANSINEPSLDRWHYHKVNLFVVPFSFKEFVDKISEPYFDRYVYLFTAEQMEHNCAFL